MLEFGVISVRRRKRKIIYKLGNDAGEWKTIVKTTFDDGKTCSAENKASSVTVLLEKSRRKDMIFAPWEI